METAIQYGISSSNTVSATQASVVAPDDAATQPANDFRKTLTELAKQAVTETDLRARTKDSAQRDANVGSAQVDGKESSRSVKEKPAKQAADPAAVPQAAEPSTVTQGVPALSLPAMPTQTPASVVPQPANVDNAEVGTVALAAGKTKASSPANAAGIKGPLVPLNSSGVDEARPSVTSGEAVAKVVSATEQAAAITPAAPEATPATTLMSHRTADPLALAAPATVSATRAASSQNAEAAASSAGAALHTAEQRPALILATPNVLEIGLASGAHGWVKVRAELGVTGEVAASVMAGSAQAAESLRKDLPAMTAYLAGEQVGVSSLAVTRAAGSGGTADAAMSFGQPQSGDAQTGSSPGGASQRGSPALEAENAEVLISGKTELASGLEAAKGLVIAGGLGGWLSVRA